MMIRSENTWFVLILAISLSIPAFSLHPHDNDLFETILSSPDIGFEDPGDEHLSICQGKSNPFVPTAFPETFLVEADLIAHPYLFSYQLISHSQDRSILLL